MTGIRTIAEAAAEFYDQAGEAGMLEYINRFRADTSGWQDSLHQLRDGSVVRFDPSGMRYIFESAKDGRWLAARAANIPPGHHPVRPERAMAENMTDRHVWEAVVRKVLEREGENSPELFAREFPPVTRYEVSDMLPGIEEEIQDEMEDYLPPESVIKTLREDAEIIGERIAADISKEDANRLTNHVLLKIHLAKEKAEQR